MNSGVLTRTVNNDTVEAEQVSVIPTNAVGSSSNSQLITINFVESSITDGDPQAVTFPLVSDYIADIIH